MLRRIARQPVSRRLEARLSLLTLSPQIEPLSAGLAQRAAGMSASKYPGPTEAAQTPPQRKSANNQRILVVEDERLSQALLHQILKVHGYQTLRSSEGREAINLARAEQPDLILMDINLPDISGLDATRLLKQDEQTKNIPVIAVTGLSTYEDEIAALKSGCAAYITKPVKIDQLLRTMDLYVPSPPSRVCLE